MVYISKKEPGLYHTGYTTLEGISSSLISINDIQRAPGKPLYLPDIKMT